MPLSVLVPEEVAFAFAVPQANVRMPAAAVFLVVPLGHKGGSQTHLMADFFDTRFKEHSFVSGSHRIVIANVHLIHARAMFAIVAFDLNAIIAHVTRNAPQQALIRAGLANGVTVEARTEWQQIRAKVFFT